MLSLGRVKMVTQQLIICRLLEGGVWGCGDDQPQASSIKFRATKSGNCVRALVCLRTNAWGWLPVREPRNSNPHLCCSYLFLESWFNIINYIIHTIDISNGSSPDNGFQILFLLGIVFEKNRKVSFDCTLFVTATPQRQT